MAPGVWAIQVYFIRQLLPSLIYYEYWLNNLTVDLTVPRQQRVTRNLRRRRPSRGQVHAGRAKGELRANLLEGHTFYPVQSSYSGMCGRRWLCCLLGYTRPDSDPTETFLAHPDSRHLPVRSNQTPLKSRKSTKTHIHHSLWILTLTGPTSTGPTSTRATLACPSMMHPPSSHSLSTRTICRRLVTRPTSFPWKYSPRSFYTQSKPIHALERS